MDERDNLSHSQKQTPSDQNKPPVICYHCYQGLVAANGAVSKIIIEKHILFCY